MELRHLRSFVAVAEILHFGRAAARLRIAQPALSHRIGSLEKELGVMLFNRTTRRVELTSEGRVFVEQARLVLDQADRAVRAVQRASRGQIGRLVIGFIPSADLDVLPRVLSVWNARFPDVEVELHTLLPGEQVEALRNGDIEVGFARLPMDDDSLVVESIQREPLVVALPERHGSARHPRVRLADLKDESLVVFPRRVAPGYHDLLVSVCRRAGFTPRLLRETESIETNLGLVAAGLGVTLLPAAIRNLQRRGVVYRPLAPPVPHVEMAVAYVRGDRSPTLQAFLHVVREVAAPRAS